MNDTSSHLPQASAFVLIVVGVAMLLLSGIPFNGTDFLTGAITGSDPYAFSAQLNANAQENVLTLNFLSTEAVDISAIYFKLQKESGGDICPVILRDTQNKIRLDSPLFGSDFMSSTCDMTLFTFADAIAITSDAQGNVEFKHLDAAVAQTLVKIFLPSSENNPTLGLKDIHIYNSDGRDIVNKEYLSLGQITVLAAPTEVCGNGIDDDTDGQIDEGCVEICGDTIDNDGDGTINEGCCSVTDLTSCSQNECVALKKVYDSTTHTCQTCSSTSTPPITCPIGKQCQDGLCETVVIVPGNCGDEECVPWFNVLEESKMSTLGFNPNKVNEFCNLWFTGLSETRKKELCGTLSATGGGFTPDLNGDHNYDGQDAEIIFKTRQSKNNGDCGEYAEGSAQAPCPYNNNLFYVCDDGSYRVVGTDITYIFGKLSYTHMATAMCPYNMKGGN